MKTGVNPQMKFSPTSDQHQNNVTAVTIFSAVLTAMMISVLSTFAQAPVYEKDVDKAIYLSNTEQTKKAVELMEKTAQSNSADAIVWFYLGYVQIKAGEVDKALNSFDKGTQLNDKEALNYAGKAYVRILQNNPVDTKTFVDKALALSKSKNPVVLNTIAEGYLTNKQFTNQALELLLKSQSLSKENPDTQILLGDTYLQLNKGGESVSSYERAAGLDAKDATPHYKMGLVYLRSKNYPVATESFNKAVSIDPNYGPAYRELGELYYQTKEGEKAVQAQEKYIPLTENPAPARRQLAFYYFMAKNYAKANEMFKDLSTDPNVSPLTLRFYAKSLFEAGDFKQAVQIFDQYFAKAKPEELEASDYAFQGKAYQKLADEQRAQATANKLPLPNPIEDSLAIDSFEKSLTLDSTQVEINQLQGDLLFKKKKYDGAIRDYKRLLVLRKKPSLDYFNLGRAYYYNSKTVDADSAFSKLIQLQPTMVVGPLWKARTLATEDPESTQGLAKPYFDKVVELASPNPEKNKNELVEAYSYLGYYYYLKADNAKSLSYWEKVLSLKPGDQRATEAIEILKKKK